VHTWGGASSNKKRRGRKENKKGHDPSANGGGKKREGARQHNLDWSIKAKKGKHTEKVAGMRILEVEKGTTSLRDIRALSEISADRSPTTKRHLLRRTEGYGVRDITHRKETKKIGTAK